MHFCSFNIPLFLQNILCMLLTNYLALLLHQHGSLFCAEKDVINLPYLFILNADFTHIFSEASLRTHCSSSSKVEITCSLIFYCNTSLKFWLFKMHLQNMTGQYSGLWGSFYYNIKAVYEYSVYWWCLLARKKTLTLYVAIVEDTLIFNIAIMVFSGG